MRPTGLTKTLVSLIVLFVSTTVTAGHRTEKASFHPERDCVVLFVDPMQSTNDVPLNHDITVYYQSSRKNACGVPHLVDKEMQKPVDVTVLQLSYPSQNKPFFINEYHLVISDAYLKTGRVYQTVLANTVLAEFQTAALKNIFQGQYNGQQALAIGFEPWKMYTKTKIIPTEGLGNPLGLLIKNLVKTNNQQVVKKVETIMGKDLPALAEKTAKYDVGLAKINYISSNPWGQKKDLSALLAYPSSKTIDYARAPIILYFHDWNQSQHAPSNGNTTDVWLAGLAASRGFIFIAPDMLGYGDTRGDQPSYFLLENTGRQAFDALSAAKTFFMEQLASSLSGKIILMGGRRGAYNATAAWIVLSKHDMDVSKIILYDGIYSTLDIAQNTTPHSLYDDYQQRIMKKTYAYYSGDISLDKTKGQNAYLYSLSELNGIAAHSAFLSKQKSTVFIYQSKDSKENVEQFLPALLKESTGLVIERSSCLSKGLDQLVNAHILSSSTACSYRAWNTLLSNS